MTIETAAAWMDMLRVDRAASTPHRGAVRLGDAQQIAGIESGPQSRFFDNRVQVMGTRTILGEEAFQLASVLDLFKSGLAVNTASNDARHAGRSCSGILDETPP